MANHRVVHIEDAFYESIGARRESGDLIEQLNAFVALAGGSMRAAARALGEPKTSFTMWAEGKRNPSKKARERLAGKLLPAIRRAQLSPVEERRLRGRQIKVSGTARYDDRERQITPQGNTADAVIDAFLAGKDMRSAFVNAINDPQNFYPGFFASDDPDDGMDVEKIEWE